MNDIVDVIPSWPAKRTPWNKGKLTGAKPPLRPKHAWCIRTKLLLQGRSAGLCVRRAKPYSGINVIMLWATAMERGYSAPIWMTYKRAMSLTPKSERAKGNAGRLRQHRPRWRDGRGYRAPFGFLNMVFNVEQISSLPAH